MATEPLSACIEAHREGRLDDAIDQLTRARDASAGRKQRFDYTIGLLQCQRGKDTAGLDLIRHAVAARPGILPLLPMPVPALESVLGELEGEPARLTVALALGESLHAAGREANARTVFVRIVRDLAGRGERPPAAPGLTEAEVRAAIAPQPIWHPIDLGGDLWIEGQGKTARICAAEILRLHAPPDLTGKTVLDIGAWGGFFSFELERRGAQGTALDYYSWVTNFVKLHEWAAREKQAGRIADNYHAPADVMDRQALPGRADFDFSHRTLGSTVRPICSVFEEATPETLGVHDVVLYLGVLYHVLDPFGALQKVASVCREMAIIETLGFVSPTHEHEPLWQFFRDDRINHDKTTWWAPNEVGLHDMLLAAGFRRVEILYGADSLLPLRSEGLLHTRIIAHAYK